MFKNKLKETLRKGQPVIGTFIMCNCAELVEIVGICGYDFVVIDTEHGPLSVESTINLIRAAELKGLTPITRVTESSDSTILRSLDVGAHGIQVPQVNDAATAKRVAKASKYYPLGTRGAALARSGDYGMVNANEYFTSANEETLVVVHCENKEGLENLEEIVRIPEIDVIFLGPFDMSQSLGVPGQVYHPLVEEAAEKVLKITKSAGKSAGIFVTDGEQARKRIEQGFQYITINVDTTLFARACKNEISKIKK